MVLACSGRIPRAPPYSGYPRLSVSFAYRTFTVFGPAFQLSSATNLSPYRVLHPEKITPFGLGSSDFARHYFRNRFYFLFLRVLRCFSSPGSPPLPMDSVTDYTILLVQSSLIRISADHRIFAPPRSFSQLVTSFFGAMYQGILRKPFVA